MIVVDASAYVDVALGRASDPVLDALEVSGHWVVPEHFRLEVMSAVRREWLAGAIDGGGLARIVGELADRGLDVWPTPILMPRILELAANATPYEAAYLALAEELGSPLVTAGAKLAGVPGIRCRVVGWE